MNTIQAKRLKKVIKRFPQARIGVVGDMTADIFIYGKPYRLSREAPVIVVRYDQEKLVPGGAANTVNNLLDLGAQVRPIGILGEDGAGKDLYGYLAEKQSRMDGIIIDSNFNTISKTRILAGDDNTTKQQVIRIDKEPEKDFGHKYHHQLLKVLQENASACDALVVSDYGYGLFSKEIIEFLSNLAKEKIVVVDSRYNLGAFKGVTLVSPNQAEAQEFTGIEIVNTDALRSAGEKILKATHSRAALITRGNKGMTLFETDKDPYHIPVYGGDEISDVTGAGDTVVALAALALVAGAEFSDAAVLANFGASVVVMKPGTATVTPDELLAVVADSGDMDR